MRLKDRRFIKTEKVIQKAMVDLLNENNPETISIDDLVNKADINKSTFYLHYQSLDLLVSALEDSVIAGLIETLSALPNNHSRFDFFDSCLVFLKGNRKMCLAVLNASTYRFNLKIEEFAKEFMVQRPQTKKLKARSSIDFLESSLTQSVVAYLRLWLLDKCRYPFEKVISDLLAICSAEAYKDIIIR